MSADNTLMAEWLRLSGHVVWDGFTSAEDIAKEFNIDAVPGGILAALYGSGDYQGSAFVLLIKEGVLYEVNGSHCSCYGLEDQWELEPTTLEALRLRAWPSYLEPQTADRMAALLDMLGALGENK